MRSLALALTLFTTPALAHTADSGWLYDGYCCSGEDCSAIVAYGHVSIEPGRVLLHLAPGDHPKVVKEFTADVTKTLKRSGDNDYHVCLGNPFKANYDLAAANPDKAYVSLAPGLWQRIICVYIPSEPF